MNRRLVALLFALVLGLQSFLAPAAASVPDTQAHCAGEMNAAHVADTDDETPPTHGEDCPCCLGMAAGCMTTGVIGATGASPPQTLVPDLRDDRVIAAQLPFLDRLDTPPTPPPIG